MTLNNIQFNQFWLLVSSVDEAPPNSFFPRLLPDLKLVTPDPGFPGKPSRPDGLGLPMKILVLFPLLT